MAITTNLFPSIKCGKDVTRNVHTNEARRERENK
jgi:hypothetical protein